MEGYAALILGIVLESREFYEKNAASKFYRRKK
jgi:hypothetical protein